MSLLRVRLVGEPVLRQHCAPVLDMQGHTGGTLQRTFDSMLETVRASDRAVALAAPQVGIPKRFFVYAADPTHPQVLVNPVITEMIGKMEVSEGCLSVPDFYPTITRAERVKGGAINRWGELIEFDEVGLLGHAIQHEVDHLDGVLMLDRMKPEDQQELLARIPPELHRVRKGIRAVLQSSQ